MVGVSAAAVCQPRVSERAGWADVANQVHVFYPFGVVTHGHRIASPIDYLRLPIENLKFDRGARPAPWLAVQNAAQFDEFDSELRQRLIKCRYPLASTAAPRVVHEESKAE